MTDNPQPTESTDPGFVPHRRWRWVQDRFNFFAIIALAIFIVLAGKGVIAIHEWRIRQVDAQVANCIANGGYVTMPIVNASVPCDTKPDYALFNFSNPTTLMTVIVAVYLALYAFSQFFKAFAE